MVGQSGFRVVSRFYMLKNMIRGFSIVPLLWGLTMLVVVGSVAGVLWWRLDPHNGFTAPAKPE